jgi:hypothetical protein
LKEVSGQCSTGAVEVVESVENADIFDSLKAPKEMAAES